MAPICVPHQIIPFLGFNLSVPANLLVELCFGFPGWRCIEKFNYQLTVLQIAKSTNMRAVVA